MATMGFLCTLCGVNTSASKKGGKKTRMQNLGLMVNTTGLYRIQTKEGAVEQWSSRAAEHEVSISAIIGQRSCLACAQLTNSGAFVDSSRRIVRWKPVPASRPLGEKKKKLFRISIVLKWLNCSLLPLTTSTAPSYLSLS